MIELANTAGAAACGIVFDRAGAHGPIGTAGLLMLAGAATVAIRVRAPGHDGTEARRKRQGVDDATP